MRALRPSTGRPPRVTRPSAFRGRGQRHAGRAARLDLDDGRAGPARDPDDRRRPLDESGPPGVLGLARRPEPVPGEPAGRVAEARAHRLDFPGHVQQRLGGEGRGLAVVEHDRAHDRVRPGLHGTHAAHAQPRMPVRAGRGLRLRLLGPEVDVGHLAGGYLDGLGARVLRRPVLGLSLEAVLDLPRQAAGRRGTGPIRDRAAAWSRLRSSRRRGHDVILRRLVSGRRPERAAHVADRPGPQLDGRLAPGLPRWPSRRASPLAPAARHPPGAGSTGGSGTGAVSPSMNPRSSIRAARQVPEHDDCPVRRSSRRGRAGRGTRWSRPSRGPGGRRRRAAGPAATRARGARPPAGSARSASGPARSAAAPRPGRRARRRWGTNPARSRGTGPAMLHSPGDPKS